MLDWILKYVSLKLNKFFIGKCYTTENMSMIPAFQSLPMDLVNEIISMVPWEGQRELHIKCMDDINKYRKRLNYYKKKSIQVTQNKIRFNRSLRDFMISKNPWENLAFKDFVLKIPYAYSPLNDGWNVRRKEMIKQRGYDALLKMSSIWGISSRRYGVPTFLPFINRR